jgi:hypothetical protein
VFIVVLGTVTLASGVPWALIKKPARSLAERVMEQAAASRDFKLS